MSLSSRFIHSTLSLLSTICQLPVLLVSSLISLSTFIYQTVFWFSPLWAPVTAIMLIPHLAVSTSLLPWFAVVGFLALTYLVTPKHNIVRSFIKGFRGGISTAVLLRKDTWLNNHGVKNLKEYYDKLTQDSAGQPPLSYQAWIEKHNKKETYPNWRHWHFEQEVFKDPSLTIQDTMINLTNHYGELMQSHVFHLNCNTQTPNPRAQKHLVMFVGRSLSAECRLEEMVEFAKKTGMYIHMVNYPSVNDATGKAYTEQDLQQCGSAVVKTLLAPSKHFPKGIPAKNISLYGNCLGSVVAELTYQDLQRNGISIARRILSNGYGDFRTGVPNVLRQNISSGLSQLVAGYNPFLRGLLTLVVLTLFSPIIFVLYTLIMVMPLFGSGWQHSPHDTAKGQDHDCLILGRADDGVIRQKRLIDFLDKNEKPAELQKHYCRIADNYQTKTSFEDDLQAILDLEEKSLEDLVQEAQNNTTSNQNVDDRDAVTRPETVVKMLKEQNHSIDRDFAEYIMLRATRCMNQHGQFTANHALVRYANLLQTQINSQEVALTDTTKQNSERMSHILHEPHYCDLHDMAVKDAKTGTVAPHDDGASLFNLMSDTSLSDMHHAQITIKQAWRSRAS